jgi:4-amino-4-deoxy-L-arabinose transferase-like glycosyltransferase
VPRAPIALTALAAALRLPTLGSPSLWLDETLTGGLARGSLGDLLHRVAEQEANPPLFYLLEWAWARVAGTSEVALRLPSALFGIALVPVAFAIGRRLGGPRAAVALAALIAVHPLLVYYAQEARGYAAVALACAVGFGCFLDALAGKRALWWALASAIALGCHYFAIFPVAIEAAILLARRGRAVLPALRVVVLAGVALLPLLARQIGGDHTDNVTGGTGLPARVKGAATSWLVGERGAAIDNLEWLIGALLLAGVGLVVIHRSRAAALPAIVGGGGAVLIGLAAVGGADYLNNRNTVPVLAIALAVPALGFAVGRAGAALGAAACLALAAATIGALIDPAHAREDWRTTARDLRAAPAVIVAPPYADVPLRWYRPALQPSPPQGVEVRELAVVLSDPDRNPLPPGALDAAPVPGFTPAGIQQHDRMLIARYRAPTPQPVQPEAVNAWARSKLDAGRGAGGATLLAQR